MLLLTSYCPWSHITLDFVTNLQKLQGHSVILKVIDHFSRVLHLIPLTKPPAAFELAELLFAHVFCYFGYPEDIVSVQWTAEYLRVIPPWIILYSLWVIGSRVEIVWVDWVRALIHISLPH